TLVTRYFAWLCRRHCLPLVVKSTFILAQSLT
ncbi:MAG: hypothetical protein ACI892_000708, partial [Marinobacter maritimus]